LTSLQIRLLEILRGQWEEAEMRQVHQRSVEKQWTAFVGTMEESLVTISVNASNLMRELLVGLLRLQSLTRDSGRQINEELRMLDVGVGRIRDDIQRVHQDIGALDTADIFVIKTLADMSYDKLAKVLSGQMYFMAYEDANRS